MSTKFAETSSERLEAVLRSGYRVDVLDVESQTVLFHAYVGNDLPLFLSFVDFSIYEVRITNAVISDSLCGSK